MTVGELREYLKQVPDNYEVRIFDRSYGDIGTSEKEIEIDKKDKKITL